MKPLVRLHTRQHRFGLGFGLLLATCTSLTVALGAILFLQAMERETRTDVEQAMGDTTRLLAAHFKNEFQHLSAHLRDFGEGTLRTQLSKVNQKPAGKPSSPPNHSGHSVVGNWVGTLDAEPEFIDASLWKRDSPNGAFDLFPEVHRVYLAMNSRYPEASLELMSEIQGLEQAEKSFVQPAFQGHIVVTVAPSSFPKKNVILMAVPLGHGMVEQVVVSHIEASKIQKGMINGGMISSVLVDDFGNILVHPLDQTSADRTFIEKRVNQKQSALFEALRAAKNESGQLEFEDEKGNATYGGYAQLGFAHLAVLGNISKAEVNTGLDALKKQSLLFFFASFMFFLGSGYLLATTRVVKLGANGILNEAHFSNEVFKKLNLIVLFGTLKQSDSRLLEENEKDLELALNEFFSIAQSTAAHYGGVFERTSGFSFLIAFGFPPIDGTEAWRAIRVGIDLRAKWLALNRERKKNGKSVLFYGIGADAGLGLFFHHEAHEPRAESKMPVVLSECIPGAKSLAQMTGQLLGDFLVSQAVWQQSDGKFLGTQVGEAKLLESGRMTGFFGISGYRNEQGELVSVDVPREFLATQTMTRPEVNLDEAVLPQKPKKWLINNGLSIVGPWEASEIASRLFSQDLDFDCECWAEGSSEPSPIRSSGVFEGSGDASAPYWVYDGKMIHGPMSAGFIKTALLHGALSESVWICEQSTINGWMPLTQKMGSVFSEVQLKEKQKPVHSLRASLAPPATDPSVLAQGSPQKKVA